MVMFKDESARARHAARVETLERLKAKAQSPDEISEDEYWALMHDLDHAPWITDWALLQERGIELPPASTLSDAHLTERLWTLLEACASWDVYFIFTDHLSDRAMYARLIERVPPRLLANIEPRDANEITPGTSRNVDDAAATRSGVWLRSVASGIIRIMPARA